MRPCARSSRRYVARCRPLGQGMNSRAAVAATRAEPPERVSVRPALGQSSKPCRSERAVRTRSINLITPERSQDGCSMTDRAVAGVPICSGAWRPTTRNTSRAKAAGGLCGMAGRLRGELAETATTEQSRRSSSTYWCVPDGAGSAAPRTRSAAIRRLTGRKKALLVGGLRLLRTLGEPCSPSCTAQAAPSGSGPSARGWFARTHADRAMLETPAWQVGPRGL